MSHLCDEWRRECGVEGCKTARTLLLTHRYTAIMQRSGRIVNVYKNESRHMTKPKRMICAKTTRATMLSQLTPWDTSHFSAMLVRTLSTHQGTATKLVTRSHFISCVLSKSVASTSSLRYSHREKGAKGVDDSVGDGAGAGGGRAGGFLLLLEDAAGGGGGGGCSVVAFALPPFDFVADMEAACCGLCLALNSSKSRVIRSESKTPPDEARRVGDILTSPLGLLDGARAVLDGLLLALGACRPFAMNLSRSWTPPVCTCCSLSAEASVVGLRFFRS